MELLTGYADVYWNNVLNRPIFWLEGVLNIPLHAGWRGLSLKILFSLIVLAILYILYLRVHALFHLLWRREHADPVLPDAAVSASAPDGEGHEAGTLTYSDEDIARLKKEKQWARLGELYTALNYHGEAATFYNKAGEYNRAAAALVAAGNSLAAARLLEKTGNYNGAALRYSESRKYRRAIRAFNKAGNLPGAANCYAQWGKVDAAAEKFLQYFKTSSDDVAQQVNAAQECHRVFTANNAWAKVGEEKRKDLWKEMASRFDSGQHDEFAAAYYRKAGVSGKAGEVYLRMGRLDEAVQCLRQAGRVQEASAAGGRFYESKGRWEEAARAYEEGEVFRRAGDCFSKANDPVRAASCYEKGGEYFGAGLALVHAQRWEQAIKMLQRVQEDSSRYDESRALLGRCFYEMKDFAHCAAALENHLTGARVNKSNIQYFWMLALAYEQMGELDDSRRALQKIRVVDMGFRDVAQRLSSIESRISMVGSGNVEEAPSDITPSATQSTEVIRMVEKSIGARYAIERELGRGGMGVVYLAKDTQLERPVALKFLGSMMDDAEPFKQRFMHEAKAAASVSHPNIVSIYDIGEQEGNAYIAMEYVAGISLSRLLSEKGGLSLREGLNIALQICSALEAIHQQGIIHRDVKPENVLIAKGGLVKVMDFGLARVQDARLTAPGMVMGTPSYMAPEQMRGEEIDARADIYALGLIFYELFTGKPAFGKGNILQQQLHEMPPALRDMDPHIPEVLDLIVRKCVAKDPEERFASATELMGMLRRVRVQPRQ